MPHTSAVSAGLRPPSLRRLPLPALTLALVLWMLPFPALGVASPSPASPLPHESEAVDAPEVAPSDEELIARARDFFRRFVELESSYDPALANLYADFALLENTVVYPGGFSRKRTFPAEEYKGVLVHALPLAEEQGQRSVYSEVTYEVERKAGEGAKVRIRTTRELLPQGYVAPFSLLVGPTARGPWRIWEEHSQSAP